MPRRIWLVWQGDNPPDLEPLRAPEEEEDLLPEATFAEAAWRMKPGLRVARAIRAAICPSASCWAAIAAAFRAD